MAGLALVVLMIVAHSSAKPSGNFKEQDLFPTGPVGDMACLRVPQ